MLKRRLLLAGLLILAVAHVSVAGSMIYRHEITLRTGEVYRFNTQPVDPYDAFRGRYVSISIDRRIRADKRIYPGQTVYAAIEVGEDGFATFSRVYTDQPPNKPYVETTARSYLQNKNQVVIQIPFDRYYMNEELAPQAEKAYRKHSSRGKSDVHVKVRVRDGLAVLEELYLDGKPIAEYLADQKG